jgi:hypothetical protein
MKIHITQVPTAQAYARENGLVDAILESYTYRTGSKMSNGFPRPDNFHRVTFVYEIERRGWTYDSLPRDARRAVEMMSIFEEDIKMLERQLEPYLGEKMPDLTAVVQNAERRSRLPSPNGIYFCSLQHAEILCQELYEAGWDWRYR